MSQNKFCVMPWRELYSTTLGTYRMCCVEDETGTCQDYQTSITEGIDAHWNSDYMKQYRLAFLENQQHASCRHCWLDEAHGKTSLRQRRNMQYLGATDEELDPWVEHFQSITQPDGTVDVDIQGVYLSVGNTCQLRCTHCNPAYSTSVAKEYQKLRWDANFKTRRIIADDRFVGITKQRAFDAEAWPQLKSIAHKLKWIRCTGGEPTLSRGLLDFMQWLDAEGLAADIRFYSNSNAISVSPDWIDAASRFKYTELKIGLDGTALVDNYVRYPTQWSRKMPIVEDLLARFPDSYILTTLHAMNIADFPNLLREMEHWGGRREITALNYPTELDIQHMPEQFKKVVIDQLETMLADWNDPGVPYPVNNRDYLNYGVRAIINRLKSPGDDTQWQLAKRIIRDYDTVRPTQLADLCPTLAPYLAP